MFLWVYCYITWSLRASYGVGREGLEQVHSRDEEVDSLVTRGVVRVAAGFQGRVAGAVVRPLVFPEGLGALVVGLPVFLHEAQGVGLTGILEESGDVLVVPRAVAVLIVAAVAIVGPEAVDSPGIVGASHWVRIPELDLLDQAVRAADAAGICRRTAAGEHRGGVRAGLVRAGQRDGK